MTNDVTIVVPYVDEHADLLGRMLASINAQTQPVAAVEVIHDQARRGAAWARNQGLARVQTEFVCFTDADDELDPDHILLLSTAQQESGADLVYACVEFAGLWERDPLAVAHQGRWVDPCGIPFGDEQDRHLRYMGNFIPIGWLARTDLIRQVGGFPPSGGQGREEDYQLLVNLRKAGARFHHTPGRTYRYFKHDRNTGGGWRGTGASNKAFR